MAEWLRRLAFIGAVGLLAFLGLHTPATVQSQTRSATDARSAAQVHVDLLPSGLQQVVVFDDNTQSMAVYHIEPNNGKIQLKSVRSLVWDLKMEQFNGEVPLPSELREVQP